MNAKIIVGLIIILLAVGGYFFYMNTSGGNALGQAQDSQNQDVVQAQDVTVGTGALAEPGTVVSILYTGKLSDGTVFDSSEAHGNEPLVFQLGTPGIIPGFQIGVNGMRVGGTRAIAVPPSLGYGAEDIKDPSGKVIIPGNSTLVFEVTLEKVEAAPASPAPASTE